MNHAYLAPSSDVFRAPLSLSNDQTQSYAGSAHSLRWRSFSEGKSICVLVCGDGVRVTWGPHRWLRAWPGNVILRDYLNAKFQAAGLVYRVDAQGLVNDGHMEWPIQGGMIFDRDPEQNRARLAAEALGSSPT